MNGLFPTRSTYISQSDFNVFDWAFFRMWLFLFFCNLYILVKEVVSSCHTFNVSACGEETACGLHKSNLIISCGNYRLCGDGSVKIMR